MKKFLATLLLAATVTTGAGLIAPNEAHAAPEATIVSSVSFRNAPNVNSDTIRYLKAGEKVQIISKVNDYWYYVQTTQGHLGYVSSNSKYIKYANAGSSGGSGSGGGAIQGIEATIVSSVNFRSAPDTNAGSIRYLKAGEKVRIISTVNAYWYYVQTTQGQLGYVSSSSKYIRGGSSGGSGGGSNAGSPNTSGTRGNIINAGKKYMGTPYEFGSDRSNTRTFDCSDFVRQAFKDGAGITLPSDSRGQGTYVKNIGKTTTNWRNLQPGDLMFFMSYKGTSKSSYPSDTSNQRITHVAIYLGDGKILGTYSKESGGVRIDSIEGRHWEHRFIFGGSALK
ncbi:MAG: hydrolase Nlp/P60 [Paenibacillus sp.]|jgi:cell wall-associated NlpC family hydrolase|nr:hydrolase Nlp/P60 [Paenibacillus sp.]